MLKGFLRLSAGLALLMIGVIGLILPILQGWIFILLAIPLISPEHGKKMTAHAKRYKMRIVEWWRKRK